MKNKLCINFNKNTKLAYYLINIFKLLIPDIFFRKRVDIYLNNRDDMKYILQRVNFYNKIDVNFYNKIDVNFSPSQTVTITKPLWTESP